MYICTCLCASILIYLLYLQFNVSVIFVNIMYYCLLILFVILFINLVANRCIHMYLYFWLFYACITCVSLYIHC